MDNKNLAIGIGVAVILIIAVFGVYNVSKTTGKVTYPVDPNRRFKSVSFSCNNGAESQIESKNCRSATYWKNYADKFCGNLCEVSESMSIDVIEPQAAADPSCDVAVLQMFNECEGNVIVAEVPTGGACTSNSMCVSGLYCIQGTCQPPACTPDCAGKECGDDGCEGTCPPGCGENQMCNANGQCVSCVQSCPPMSSMPCGLFYDYTLCSGGMCSGMGTQCFTGVCQQTVPGGNYQCLDIRSTLSSDPFAVLSNNLIGYWGAGKVRVYDHAGEEITDDDGLAFSMDNYAYLNDNGEAYQDSWGNTYKRSFESVLSGQQGPFTCSFFDDLDNLAATGHSNQLPCGIPESPLETSTDPNQITTTLPDTLPD